MSTIALSNAALLASIQNDPRFAEMAKEYEAKAVEALGTSLSLPQIAATYQAFKGQPKSLGSAWSKQVATECLAIIKQNGYKADWNGIVALVAHEA